MSLDNKIVTASFIPFVLLLAAPFLYMAYTGDYLGSRLTYGVEEDSPIVDLFLNINFFFRNLFN